ncbi:NAD(P)-dependent oxidoreductase [Roseomonas sp. GC11]|uniref:NAD-dependent epimerase/dehydratase family protein n=1 Tax=Roseomonas sp. GC11 TaxID=2950546 RepID=UPI00210A3126|nr:NAD(P)-dependent oxidoreductase [Roseomonas sp. GC11]MCQ4159631.1 NAD(P)-dependent oxidoreductase [Roseomonas sp. GC11]
MAPGGPASAPPPALDQRLAAALAAAGAAPVIVTGAGGWLGLVTLDLLRGLLGENFGTRVLAYGSHARPIALPGGAVLPCRALPELDAYDGPPPLVIHHACLTKDRVAALGVAAFLEGNDAIRGHVAWLLRRRGAAGLFLPSSGAVYGPGRVLARDAAANPYGVSKLRDEALFSELAAAAGIPLVIARVFNMAGPFINKPEAYALASFLVALAAGRAVEIRAAGRVVRSYLHAGDLLRLALGALLLRPAEAPFLFDTEGEVAIEVGDLARRCAAVLGRPEAVIHRAAPDGRPDDVYVGDGTAMRALAAALGLPLRPLDVQIAETAASLAPAA